MWCMRTNIVLNDDLVREAMTFSSARSKTALVEEALRTFVEVRTAEEFRKGYAEGLLRLEPRLRALKLRRKPGELLRSDRDRA
jgi:Arc/MetJ family transcription regulator